VNSDPSTEEEAHSVLLPVVPEEDLAAAVEAVLLVADGPVAAGAVAAAVGVDVERAADLLRGLAADLAARRRGFELREVAGGWRLTTRADLDAVVDRFVVGGQQARLTQAALETLAVIAYRQPVSRGRVAAVRGVNVDGVVRTLAARGLVEEAGSDPDSGALTYRTTDYFLERLGLRSLDELPPLAPLLPDLGDLDDSPS
jgi:segregation and condensation protein B